MVWNWGIARRGATAASSFSLLVPLISGVLSAIVLGEAFGALKLIGAGLILLGLVALLRDGAQTSH